MTVLLLLESISVGFHEVIFKSAGRVRASLEPLRATQHLFGVVLPSSSFLFGGGTLHPVLYVCVYFFCVYDVIHITIHEFTHIFGESTATKG